MLVLTVFYLTPPVLVIVCLTLEALLTRGKHAD